MNTLRRIEQQANVIEDLGRELRYESSYRGVERLIQLIIQALLDLGLMVLSALGSSPKGYSDVAASLSKLGLLNFNDVELMRSMAGLRNVLVHAYIGVNREIVKKTSEKLPEDAIRLADKILSSAKQRLHDPPKAASEIIETLKRVFKGRVKIAFLFGSQVKGYRLKGDIDVAVYFGRFPDPYEVGALVSDLNKALGREDIDILIIDDCDNIALAYESIQGEPIVGNEAEILWLKTKITSQYIDYKEKLSYIKATFSKDSSFYS
ncbi:MAG: type VII toxin-antitoxin system HepT family RNase toxin [Nitrososphaerales archaeon]